MYISFGKQLYDFPWTPETHFVGHKQVYRTRSWLVSEDFHDSIKCGLFSNELRKQQTNINKVVEGDIRN